MHLKRSILGSLASFGVAFVLISTAGAASAQEAPTAPSSDEATIGEPLFVERPAPRPDPANELRSDPAPADSVAAPAPSPAPAPAPTSVAAAPRSPASAPAPVPVAVQPAPVRPAASAPARATEVQGVQIVRSAAPGDATDTALALTGIDLEVGLTVLAGVLLALGAALIRLSRSPRLA